jgi:hypothetical protein
MRMSETSTWGLAPSVKLRQRFGGRSKAAEGIFRGTGSFPAPSELICRRQRSRPVSLIPQEAWLLSSKYHSKQETCHLRPSGKRIVKQVWPGRLSHSIVPGAAGRNSAPASGRGRCRLRARKPADRTCARGCPPECPGRCRSPAIRAPAESAAWPGDLPGTRVRR